MVRKLPPKRTMLSLTYTRPSNNSAIVPKVGTRRIIAKQSIATSVQSKVMKMPLVGTMEKRDKSEQKSASLEIGVQN